VIEKRLFGSKKEEVTKDWRKMNMRSFITYALQQT
jgi:hypothetical protein